MCFDLDMNAIVTRVNELLMKLHRRRFTCSIVRFESWVGSFINFSIERLAAFQRFNIIKSWVNKSPKNMYDGNIFKKYFSNSCQILLVKIFNLICENVSLVPKYLCIAKRCGQRNFPKKKNHCEENLGNSLRENWKPDSLEIRRCFWAIMTYMFWWLRVHGQLL